MSISYDDIAERGRRPQNQLDGVADDLAAWIDGISSRIAEAVIGGLAAPFAAKLSEGEKLAYYTRQFFTPDGQPNLQGRVREIERLGPEGFALVLKDILAAHPEWKQGTPGSPGAAQTHPWANVVAYDPPPGAPPAPIPLPRQP